MKTNLIFRSRDEGKSYVIEIPHAGVEILNSGKGFSALESDICNAVLTGFSSAGHYTPFPGQEVDSQGVFEICSFNVQSPTRIVVIAVSLHGDKDVVENQECFETTHGKYPLEQKAFEGETLEELISLAAYAVACRINPALKKKYIPVMDGKVTINPEYVAI